MNNDSNDLDGLSIEQINEMFKDILEVDGENDSLIAWCNTSKCGSCKSGSGCSSNYF